MGGIQPRVWILALGERVGERRVQIEWGGWAKKQKYATEVAAFVQHSTKPTENTKVVSSEGRKPDTTE